MAGVLLYLSFYTQLRAFFVPDDADDHDEQRACIVLLFAVLDRAGGESLIMS